MYTQTKIQIASPDVATIVYPNDRKASGNPRRDAKRVGEWCMASWEMAGVRHGVTTDMGTDGARARTEPGLQFEVFNRDSHWALDPGQRGRYNPIGPHCPFVFRT